MGPHQQPGVSVQSVIKMRSARVALDNKTRQILKNLSASYYSLVDANKKSSAEKQINAGMEILYSHPCTRHPLKAWFHKTMASIHLEAYRPDLATAVMESYFQPPWNETPLIYEYSALDVLDEAKDLLSRYSHSVVVCPMCDKSASGAFRIDSGELVCTRCYKSFGDPPLGCEKSAKTGLEKA